MIAEPVSKQFLRKASELLAGLLSMFGFYTAMFVSVYNITFNQESFRCSVIFLQCYQTLLGFIKIVTERERSFSNEITPRESNVDGLSL